LIVVLLTHRTPCQAWPPIRVAPNTRPGIEHRLTAGNTGIADCPFCRPDAASVMFSTNGDFRGCGLS